MKVIRHENKFGCICYAVFLIDCKSYSLDLLNKFCNCVTTSGPTFKEGPRGIIQTLLIILKRCHDDTRDKILNLRVQKTVREQ